MEFLRPGEDSRKNWRAINALEDSRRRHAVLLGVTEDDYGRVRLTPRGAVMHPFKIYQMPLSLRTSVDANTWRKFRVRAGRVLESDATGTDGESWPDGQLFPSAGQEVTVPATTAQFWFWLEIGSSGGTTTAVVRWHSDPTATSYDGGEDTTAADWTSTNAWTGFPVIDAEHVPIGWVDTNTKASEKVALVRQLLRADLIGGTGEECPYG
jgi:hypothetical protein